MNRSRQVKGRAKEVTGEATGNRKLEWSGKKDMALGEVKELGNREGAAATGVGVADGDLPVAGHVAAVRGHHDQLGAST